jgi:erythromycin esterase-like protein
MRQLHDILGKNAERLLAHLDRYHPPTRAVIWAHNSHLGDARATEMGQRGELNVGQLCRQKWGADAVLIGFSTHSGTVTAADDWDGPAHKKRVRPGISGSCEQLFHEAFSGGDAMVILRDDRELAEALAGPRLQRAIGVIYRPRTERQSHYFEAVLPRQFDAMLHIDVTTALEPLEREAVVKAGDVPETYPTGV